MSGISRIDPAVPAGHVVVRVLLGGFSEPAVGLAVQLKVFDGENEIATYTATSDSAGRATFTEGAQFVGKVARASVSFDSGVAESQPIPLSSEGGSRLLLVRPQQAGDVAMPPSDHGGAANEGQVAPHGGHGGDSGIKPPSLCKPNPLPEQPPGTLIVGTIDFNGTGKLDARPNVEVELFAQLPDTKAAPLRMTARSNEEGRATFSDVNAEKYPPGTLFWAQALPSEPDVLPPPPPAQAYGDPNVAAGVLEIRLNRPSVPVLRSEKFERPDGASVVLLTRNCTQVDKIPAANIDIEVHSRSKLGDEASRGLRSDENGIARLGAQEGGESLVYWVVAKHQGAPFRSDFFMRPVGQGAALEMRLYDVTDDPKVAMSAVQFEVIAREGDLAQVNRRYEVMVSGTKAFWPAGGLRISAGEKSRGVQVLSSARDQIEQIEEEPFARLIAPLVPGPPVDLSLAYMLPVNSDGEVDVEWIPPFPVVKALAVAQAPVELVSGGQGAPQVSNHEGGAGAAVVLHDLHLEPLHREHCKKGVLDCPEKLIGNGGVAIHFKMHGLAHFPPLARNVGIGLAVVFGIGLIVVVGTHRRKDPAQVLRERKAALEQVIIATSGEVDASVIDELDRVNHQLDAIERPVEQVIA
jgi:hypothetical protein